MTSRISIFLAILFIAACTPDQPDPIEFSSDQCAFCRMTISDKKFGAAVVTDKGRTYYYDATECTINHLASEDISPQKIYAVAYNDPGVLYPVSSLTFVISSEFRSPMGANLAAFETSEIDALAISGKRMDWQQLNERLSNE